METVKQVLSQDLGSLLPARAIASILATMPPCAVAPVGTLDLVSTQELMRLLCTGLKLFGGAASPEVLRRLRQRITGGALAAPHTEHIRVRSDGDVLTVQSRCQALCRDFFSSTDCVRLATAASELARNIYMYAREGELTLEVAEAADGVRLVIVAADRGPGIPDVEQVLSGRYVSRTGLGRGLCGTRALLDALEINSAPGRGTTVRGWKRARR